MELKSKKIISREILILFSIILLSFTIFIGTYGFNYYKRLKKEKLEKDINEREKNIKNLSNVFDYKQRHHHWIFEQFRFEFSDVGYQKELNDEEKLWDRLTTVGSGIFNKEEMFFFRLGFPSFTDFKKYIEDKTISNEDSTNYKLSLIQQKEVDNLLVSFHQLEDEILSFREQKNIGYTSLIILLLIMFVLRYVYYLIRWCIKILKE